MLQKLETDFRQALPDVDFCALRYVSETNEILTVRQDVVEPDVSTRDSGVMITVADKGGFGYAATCDLSLSGLKDAIQRARAWAEGTAQRGITDFSKVPYAHAQAEYIGPKGEDWDAVPLNEKLDLLRQECRRLKTDDRIVDWQTSLWHITSDMLYLTSGGGRIFQQFTYTLPGMHVVANQKADTQRRSLGGLRENCLQGGMEVMDTVGFRQAAPVVAEEALALLDAPNCPAGKMDVVLAADQMVLQIHESIGHPLELDRILGDERNYAGTSFVTPDMFGTYRYGSDLLNITYDPTRPEQFATFGFDDEGLKAEKTFIIKKGLLERPLGGTTSQARAGLPGVANCRACHWNRPPIDRMANLNLESGDSTLDALIGQVENGVYMKTNRSWSIDDSRNKFQFGCEWARVIRDGALAEVVKNPNYRGISATFWRNLMGVGNEETVGVLGTPFCGKGEPNQCIRVGHATPACLFHNVDVFGGDA